MVEAALRTRVLEAIMSSGDGHDLGAMEEVLPTLARMLSDVVAPDFECVMFGLPPTPPVAHSGLEGLADAWRDYGESFETVRAELEEVREGPDAIVMLVQQKAVTRHQSVPITQPSAMLLAFEGDRVSRVEFHLDRDEALRRAGLAD